MSTGVCVYSSQKLQFHSQILLVANNKQICSFHLYVPYFLLYFPTLMKERCQTLENNGTGEKGQKDLGKKRTPRPWP